MNSDIILLLWLGLACLALMLMVKFVYSTKVALLHLGTFVAYTSLLMYGMYFAGQGGTSLVWWCILIFAYILHFIVLLITALYKKFK